MHPMDHANTTVKMFGGRTDDYIKIHDRMDSTKAHFCDYRHRALWHHSFGVDQIVKEFGPSLVNADGQQVDVKAVAEQHILEDCGGIVPSVSDWFDSLFMPRREVEVPDCPVIRWLDEPESLSRNYHALRYHSLGIFEAERKFGHSIIRPDGSRHYVRYIAERHVKQTFKGVIPTVQDWLKQISVKPWMARTHKVTT